MTMTPLPWRDIDWEFRKWWDWRQTKMMGWNLADDACCWALWLLNHLATRCPDLTVWFKHTVFYITHSSKHWQKTENVNSKLSHHVKALSVKSAVELLQCLFLWLSWVKPATPPQFSHNKSCGEELEMNLHQNEAKATPMCFYSFPVRTRSRCYLKPTSFQMQNCRCCWLLNSESRENKTT